METAMENREACAAIAMALHEHGWRHAHDSEPGVITIKASASEWCNHQFRMTERP